MEQQTASEQHPDDSGGGPEPATVHEIRPVGNLKVCPSCLVQNEGSDEFCTACGMKLPVSVADAADDDAEIAGGSAAETAVLAAPARVRRWPMRALLAAAVAGLAAFAVLWFLQLQHTHKLSRSLSSTEATLASTRSTLHQTQSQLSAATSLSNRRRAVLLQAKDVLGKVDPLLSSVDTIQSKAGSLGDEGSSLSGDSETFISTVSDLVNYMLNNNAAYYDYTWINQEIDTANSELSTIRTDEAIFSGDSSDYGTASTGFGAKASAFTTSVRALEKQLNQAVNR